MAYKILSLDGGGSWSLIQALVLKDLYPGKSGHEILRNFDLVIANSGGSLVLSALCCNIAPADIADILLDENERKQVFSKLSFGENIGWGIAHWLSKKFGPRYSAKRKEEGLREVLRRHAQPEYFFADTHLPSLPKLIGKESLSLLVCGFNYYTERAVFFRSNPFSNTDSFSSDKYEVSLLHAVHSASNAPLNYFDKAAKITAYRYNAPDQQSPEWYWDGAVGGFNNPVLAGLIEALTNHPSGLTADYRILSLGTGTGRRPIITGYGEGTDEQRLKEWKANQNNDLVCGDEGYGFMKDLPKMATSILADPPDTATFVAYSILHPDLDEMGSIVRINPCFSPVKAKNADRYEIPAGWKASAKDYHALLDLDMDAVSKDEVALIKNLCESFIVDEEGEACMPNQYIRGSKSAPKKLGHGTYLEAKRHWKQLDNIR